MNTSIVHTAALAVAILLSGGGLGRCCAAPPQWTGKGAEIHEAFQRLETLGFSGVVLAARDGEIVMADGFGWANQSARIPWSTGTISCIGSITKQFTAAAIMKLEAAGQLRTEDALGKFWPDCPPDKAVITIHHLLTHTSGLPDSLGGDYDPMLRDELVKKAFAVELDYTPGTEHRYSNLGYSILGAIVERVSGRPYEQFLRHELLIPAGLFETGYRLSHFPAFRVARGYERGVESAPVLEEPWADDGPYWNLRGNGGIHSTVFDMYRWSQALLAERVVPAEQLRKLITPKPLPDGREVAYAYGWGTGRTSRGTIAFGHSGGNGIFHSDLRIYPEEKAVTFLMTNQAEFPASAYSGVAARLLFGEPYQLPPALKTAEVSESDLRALSGEYTLASGGRIHVTVLGNRLRVSAQGQPAVALLAGAPLEDQAALSKLSERATTILDLLHRGGEGGAKTSADDEAVANRLRKHWNAIIEERGACRRCDVLGTAPWRQERGGWAATWLRLEFANGNRIARLHWQKDGTYVGLGGEVFPWPVTLIGVPTSAHTFTAVDEQGQFPVVEFVRQESAGSPARLVLRTPATTMEAVAVSPQP